MINSPEFGIKLLTALRDEQDKRKALETELDRSKEWYSIKRVANLNGVSHKKFDWRKLKSESSNMGYEVRKIFDANYGEVNTYHMRVWEKVYPNMELKAAKGDAKAAKVLFDLLGEQGAAGAGGMQDMDDDPITASLKEEMGNGLL